MALQQEIKNTQIILGDKMGYDLVAYPKDYRTAVDLFNKRKELESYHDDFIPNNTGIGHITVVHPKNLADLIDTATVFNKLTPSEIAYIRLPITGFVYGNTLPEKQSVNIVKKRLALAIESVGLDSKMFRFELV